jgi:YfiH family protein
VTGAHIMMSSDDLIVPNWPAPANVVALATTRIGLAGYAGASIGSYSHFNLGDHVDDSPLSVAKNRAALLEACDKLDSIAWLQQVHGVEVSEVSGVSALPICADASITQVKGLACAVLTADCLPVLFCRVDGGAVASAHAGWRGLCAGVLANTVNAFNCPPQKLMAWIGPAISQAHFEVGSELYRAFLKGFSGVSTIQIDGAFRPSVDNPGYFYADISALAQCQLQNLGVAWVGGGDMCTYSDADRFYSFRRDGQTGRQVSLIYRR